MFSVYSTQYKLKIPQVSIYVGDLTYTAVVYQWRIYDLEKGVSSVHLIAILGNGSGRHLRLANGERFVCVRKHAHAWGVWGYAPTGKFCKLDALRLLLRPLLAQTGTTVIIVICTSSHV